MCACGLLSRRAHMNINMIRFRVGAWRIKVNSLNMKNVIRYCDYYIKNTVTPILNNTILQALYVYAPTSKHTTVLSPILLFIHSYRTAGRISSSFPSHNANISVSRSLTWDNNRKLVSQLYNRKNKMFALSHLSPAPFRTTLRVWPNRAACRENGRIKTVMPMSRA